MSAETARCSSRYTVYTLQRDRQNRKTAPRLGLNIPIQHTERDRSTYTERQTDRPRVNRNYLQRQRGARHIRGYRHRGSFSNPSPSP